MVYFGPALLVFIPVHLKYLEQLKIAGTNTDQVLACRACAIVVSITFTSSLVWGEPDNGFTPIV